MSIVGGEFLEVTSLLSNGPISPKLLTITLSQTRLTQIKMGNLLASGERES